MPSRREPKRNQQALSNATCLHHWCSQCHRYRQQVHYSTNVNIVADTYPVSHLREGGLQALRHLGELCCLCCAVVLLARCLCVCNSLGGPTSSSSVHLLLAAAWQVGHDLLQDARPGEVLQTSKTEGDACTASSYWPMVICSTMPSLGLTYSTATGELHLADLPSW